MGVSGSDRPVDHLVDSSQSSLLSAFNNRRVLVTGHTGFKGAWLTIWLQALGADTYGLALPPDEPSLFASAQLDETSEQAYGDVRDPDTLSQAFSSYEPEIVFHLAAQSLVRRGYERPVETYQTNVMGTVNLLEAVRQSSSVQAVVVVSSDKCYENRETLWSYRETDPVGGHDPYSSSKGCAELVTAAYRRSFFGNGPTGPFVATARAGNVIGGGDWSDDRLVPDIVRAITSDEPIVVRNPNSVRPWQHVLEPLRGYLMLAASLLAGGPGFAEEWNFGPNSDEVLTVEDLTRAVIDAWGKGSMVVSPENDPPHEASLLRLDISKARQLLGYRPLIDSQDAVEMTVRWYSDHLSKPDMARQICEAQIAEYSNLIE